MGWAKCKGKGTWSWKLGLVSSLVAVTRGPWAQKSSGSRGRSRYQANTQ